MFDLISWVETFSISAAFVAMYYAIFAFVLKEKPNLISIIIGASGVAIASYFIETYLYYLFFSIFISLVFIAPIIEELIKFSATIYGKQIRNGLGVGLGFALSENALYFHNFLANLSLFIALVVSYLIMRGFADPLLHSFTASLDAKTWEKRNPLWIIGSIGTHIGYNFLAVLMAAITFLPDIYIIVLTEIIMLFAGIFFVTRKKEILEKKIQEIQVKKEPEEVLKIDNNNLESFVNSIKEIYKKKGFEGVARIFNFRDEYERTRIIRTAEFDSDKRSEMYIEIGIYGWLIIAILIIAFAYLIDFLFF